MLVKFKSTLNCVFKLQSENVKGIGLHRYDRLKENLNNQLKGLTKAKYTYKIVKSVF